jgi:hypothetical protein
MGRNFKQRRDINISKLCDMYNFRHNFLFKLRIAKIQNAKIEGASHILRLSLSRGHAALSHSRLQAKPAESTA